MTRSPMLWGAGLACALGGAIAGNALGSTPVTDRSAITTFYQTHQSAIAAQHDQRALPDHYPLVTRSGVVPVAQLADRGLYSQARYSSFLAAAGYAADIDDDPGPGLEETDPAVSQHAPPTAAAAVPPEPLDLAQGPAQLAGRAKIIDVQATLAMR
ncbi:MAG TPA: hypothetical protein VFS87_04740 [Qipengyuania sp.]|nr:hypothetical protein [Qipengyuania sp.]